MSGQKYKALCAEVGQLTASHSRTIDSMQKAEEKLREAIALCPNRRDAHGMIAQLMVAHSADGAAKHYLRTVELSVGRDEMWAKSVVMTFDHFLSKRHEVSGLAPPAWWTDETLKSYLSNAKERAIGRTRASRARPKTVRLYIANGPSVRHESRQQGAAVSNGTKQGDTLFQKKSHPWKPF
mmetsp:Transcript_52363/g.120363  ORF Transcript_52363/g.120363 Transcript_52363/m.120363 type:complete len:181 (-) Transcript_52363:44-586(-)